MLRCGGDQHQLKSEVCPPFFAPAGAEQQHLPAATFEPLFDGKNQLSPRAGDRPRTHTFVAGVTPSRSTRGQLLTSFKVAVAAERLLWPRICFHTVLSTSDGEEELCLPFHVMTSAHPTPLRCQERITPTPASLTFKTTPMSFIIAGTFLDIQKVYLITKTHTVPYLLSVLLS